MLFQSFRAQLQNLIYPTIAAIPEVLNKNVSTGLHFPFAAYKLHKTQASMRLAVPTHVHFHSHRVHLQNEECSAAGTTENTLEKES